MSNLALKGKSGTSDKKETVQKRGSVTEKKKESSEKEEKVQSLGRVDPFSRLEGGRIKIWTQNLSSHGLYRGMSIVFDVKCVLIAPQMLMDRHHIFQL